MYRNGTQVLFADEEKCECGGNCGCGGNCRCNEGNEKQNIEEDSNAQD